MTNGTPSPGLPTATPGRNCTTCKHFRKAGVSGTAWHCALLTRADLVADGYAPPDGETGSLQEFVCEDWEEP